MKQLIFIAAMLLTSYCMRAQTSSTTVACLSLPDAEKVLGQPSKLVESTSETKNGIVEVKCTYTATDADSKTGKRGNLYYRAIEYASAKQAQDTLAKFEHENRNNAGWTHLTGIGDEAISHTDTVNFHLFMARKRNKMVVIKVNKVTALTAPLKTLLSVGEKMIKVL